MRTYRVDRHLRGWAVYDDTGARVTAAASCIDTALTSMDYLVREQERRAQEMRRDCMCCRVTFLSKGIHNRLCGGCSADARRMVA
jgi:hypothetical protein